MAVTAERAAAWHPRTVSSVRARDVDPGPVTFVPIGQFIVGHSLTACVGHVSSELCSLCAPNTEDYVWSSEGHMCWIDMLQTKIVDWLHSALLPKVLTRSAIARDLCEWVIWCNLQGAQCAASAHDALASPLGHLLPVPWRQPVRELEANGGGVPRSQLQGPLQTVGDQLSESGGEAGHLDGVGGGADPARAGGAGQSCQLGQRCKPLASRTGCFRRRSSPANLPATPDPSESIS